MAIEYDKHGDPIYRPSVSQVIAERLLDYVAKVNADPEATFHPEDFQIIIEDALTVPYYDQRSVEQVIATRKYLGILSDGPDKQEEIEKLRKIMGGRLFAQTKKDFEIRMLMEKMAENLKKQQAPAQTKKPRRKRNDLPKGND